MRSACRLCGAAELEPFCRAVDRLAAGPVREFQVLRCPSCSVGQTEPFPLPPQLFDYYPKSYLGDTLRVIDEYRSGRWRGTSSWRMEAEKAKLVERERPGGRILDVGCGEGKFLWALDPDRWSRYGVEPAPEVAAAAKAVPGVEVRPGTLEEAGYESASMDVLTFWHVLEHVPDPRGTLQEAARILRGGGCVVVSAPNFAGHQADWFREDWYAFGDVPRHLFHFTPEALRRLLEECGLQPSAPLFFSKAVNFHCWKHSLRSWLRRRWRAEWLFPACKPALHLLPWLEAATGRPGIFTMTGRKRT